MPKNGKSTISEAQYALLDKLPLNSELKYHILITIIAYFMLFSYKCQNICMDKNNEQFSFLMRKVRNCLIGCLQHIFTLNIRVASVMYKNFDNTYQWCSRNLCLHCDPFL